MPFEAWRGVKPSIRNLKVFGCVAYALVKTSQHKLDKKSERCIFIGYSLQSKAYRLYNPVSGKLIISQDVMFNKAATCPRSMNKDGKTILIPCDNETPTTDTEPISEPSSPAHSSPHSPESPSLSSSSSSDASSSDSPPPRFRDLKDVYDSCQFALYVSDPTDYDEVAKNQVWQDAMLKEIEAIKKNLTWELADAPTYKNIVGLKWLFRTKYNADGIRVFLALAAQLKLPVYQFDVKSAFLNGDLNEEVYVLQPQGFVTGDSKNKVYKLNKALYGLKQAPRAWVSINFIGGVFMALDCLIFLKTPSDGVTMKSRVPRIILVHGTILEIGRGCRESGSWSFGFIDY
ncbi:retrovirus-related pol polyprotein from transposon TNT 1-94 [Tanacetum coccineum]